MTVEQLKKKVEEHRDGLRANNGIVKFSVSGPVGMSVIDNIVAVLEAQEARISQLEGQIKQK